MDDVDISLLEMWFYGTIVCVSILIFILVLLALAYGFVRVVLTAWEHLAPSVAEGSRPSPAPVKSHAPGKRRDDLYGRHRGDRPASRAG